MAQMFRHFTSESPQTAEKERLDPWAGDLDKRDDWRASLRLFIQNQMECSKIPGLSIVVVHNGEVLMKEGFGTRDLVRHFWILNMKEGSLPVDAETLFGIGSMSKAFTTTSLVCFVDIY